MRLVLQRVSRAEVAIDGATVAHIGPGLLLLVGFGPEDGDRQIEYWTRRVPEFRLFPDAAGKMNLSVLETGGGLLVVPNFTLYAQVSKGRRPGFSGGAEPERAAALLDQFVSALRARDLPVEAGRFGEHMEVSLVNDGPITLVLDDAALE
jgi:D-tyrosyl-tRNA(Tyr) deacylase